MGGDARRSDRRPDRAHRCLDRRASAAARRQALQTPRDAAFADKQMPLLEGSPTFYDLDVIEDRT
jgi:hypothetical protein